MPVAREWQAAIGLQDCMVVVGGRVDIPEFEPIPISSDTMCSAVEILWHRPPSDAQPPTGATPKSSAPAYWGQRVDTIKSQCSTYSWAVHFIHPCSRACVCPFPACL